MAKKLLKQYEILFFKAKEDFIASKYLFDGFNNHNLELNLEIIFFHLQQSSEKLIKTLLDFDGIKFPHTHDLEDLIYLLNQNQIETIENIEDLIPLSEYAVEGRYAILHDDMEDVNRYIDILENFFKFVAQKINYV